MKKRISGLMAAQVLYVLCYCQQLPMKATRTILFDTDEGAYMSVVVSPKGDSLAFDLLGDIYRIAVTGGNAIQITNGMAIHRNPEWTADGIIYESDITGEFPRSKRIINDTLVSKDANWKVYYSIGKLNVINTVSKVQKTLLTFDKRLQPNYFSLSPDSKFVYISYGGKIHRIELETGKDSIIPFTANVKVDAAKLNYNTYQISQQPFAVKYTRTASISPDKKQVVFAALSGIYIKEFPNGKPHLLIDQEVNQFQPVFSPDGKSIAYTSWNDNDGGAFWKLSSTGGKPEQLSKESGQYQRPAWSPDGKKIAVIRGEAKLGGRDDAGKGQLLLIDIETKEEKIIATNIPLWNMVQFSADGKVVYYVPGGRTSRKLQPQLIKQNISDTIKESVVTANLDFTPQHQFMYRLSPDEKYLVYSAGEDLYFLKRENDQPFLINDNTAALRFASGVDPCWDKEGKTLYWSYFNRFYAISLNKLIAALPANGLITTTLKTDKEIALNVSAAPLTGKGTIVLTNARLVTMKGTQVIEKGYIIIKEGRFAAVGDMSKFVNTNNATVFDMQGKSIIPGIIDLHCHMRVSSEVYPQQPWMMKAQLAYGVTTARDPSLSYDSYGFAELLQTGQMIGPRLFTVGRSVNLVFGLRMESLEDARLIANKRKQMGSIAVKQYNLPTRTQKQWLAMACNEAGINMTNEGDRNPLYQIAMLKDGSTGIEHSPMWRDAYSDIITLYAKSGTWLTPTLQVDYGSDGAKEYMKYHYWREADEKLKRFTFISDTSQKKPYPTSNGPETLQTIQLTEKPKDDSIPGFLHAAKIIAAIYKLGGKIGLGSHGNNPGIGAHNEIWALKMGGLNNYEALKIATIHGAEALGVQKDLGSIEAGKIADLIILNKNPLDDIHNTREIKYVMKDGVLYDGDTLKKIKF